MEDEKDREKLFLDYPLGKIRMLKQQNIMKDRIASVLIRKITFQIEKEKKAWRCKENCIYKKTNYYGMYWYLQQIKYVI